MKPKPAKDQNAYLYDMMESARTICRYMEGVTFDDFWDNGEKRDAVAMRIAAIGDAARNVTKATESAIPAIPFSSIRGMRNRIAHDYGKVDFREVWTVAAQDIKPLAENLGAYFDRRSLADFLSDSPLKGVKLDLHRPKEKPGSFDL
jgi:uncharacterized protein with HEPN domain